MEQANASGGPRISTPNSDVSVWIKPTDEELMIAQHTLAPLSAKAACDRADAEAIFFLLTGRAVIGFALV